MDFLTTLVYVRLMTDVNVLFGVVIQYDKLNPSALPSVKKHRDLQCKNMIFHSNFHVQCVVGRIRMIRYRLEWVNLYRAAIATVVLAYHAINDTENRQQWPDSRNASHFLSRVDRR